MTRPWILLLLAAATARADERELDVHRWKVIERESGPVSYYEVKGDPNGAFIHAAYRVGLKSVVLGVEVDDADRGAARKLRWRWRAVAFPQGSDPCVRGKGDAAAAVYVSWKRGARWYTLKYVFGTGSPEGTVCHRKRGPFAAQTRSCSARAGRSAPGATRRSTSRRNSGPTSRTGTPGRRCRISPGSGS